MKTEKANALKNLKTISAKILELSIIYKNPHYYIEYDRNLAQSIQMMRDNRDRILAAFQLDNHRDTLYYENVADQSNEEIAKHLAKCVDGTSQEFDDFFEDLLACKILEICDFLGNEIDKKTTVWSFFKGMMVDYYIKSYY